MLFEPTNRTFYIGNTNTLGRLPILHRCSIGFRSQAIGDRRGHHSPACKIVALIAKRLATAPTPTAAVKQDNPRDCLFRSIMPLGKIDFHFAVHAVHLLVNVDFSHGVVIDNVLCKGG